MYCHCIGLINSFVGWNIKEQYFAILIQIVSKKLIRTAYRLIENKEGETNSRT
jgi:hypothetical protein